MNNSKICAIIPARAGSKGIKDKNIRKLNGKPLISYSIEAGLKSKYIDEVFVSTDSLEIASISKQYGAKVPFLRPENLALDESKTIDAIIYTIQELKKIGYIYEYIVLLQPTQPLRQYWHIDEAIELIIRKDEESLISISKVKDNPVLIRRVDGKGHAINLLDGSSTVRRQDFQDFYKVNGSIYINKINEKFDENISLNDNKLVYIIDQKYDIDIDEYIDLDIAELMLGRI